MSSSLAGNQLTLGPRSSISGVTSDFTLPCIPNLPFEALSFAHKASYRTFATMSLRASSSRSAKAVSRRISTPAISQLPCTCYAQTRQASVTQNARSSLVSRRWQSTASYATAATPANDFENHDIVIVGGGLVGLALANAMGPQISSLAHYRQ